MSKFNVGDRVFHVGYGLGVVSSLDYGTYPLCVRFDSVGVEVIGFSMEGKYSTRHLIPSLLTLDEAKAKGYDVPKEKVKRWRWAYYINGRWEITPHVPNFPHLYPHQRLDASEIEVEV